MSSAAGVARFILGNHTSMPEAWVSPSPAMRRMVSILVITTPRSMSPTPAEKIAATLNVRRSILSPSEVKSSSRRSLTSSCMSSANSLEIMTSRLDCVGLK